MKVTVVGAGKMGLPLACQFAYRGANVKVCDIRRSVVDAINQGICPIDEPGVPELLSSMVAHERLIATTDIAGAASDAEVIVIIVPVLLTRDNSADLSIIEAVTREVASTVRRGAMVSYETTLPVGTTRCLAAAFEERGLSTREDIDVVFSPERVKSQMVLNNLTRNAKIVGGITPRAASRAQEFYSEYLGAPVINVGSLESAELVKLAGMVYRDVVIAVTNEIARYAESASIDLHSIIPAINTDGEAALLSPGIGVGGHCAPVYPYFMISDAERRGIDTPMTRLARKLNDEQAAWMIDRLETAWRPVQDQNVLVLGLGFRPQVKEHYRSSSFLICSELERRGAHVHLNDILYTDDEIREHGFKPLSLETEYLPPALVLSTAHDTYCRLDMSDLARKGVRVVVDGRAAWQPTKVREAGITYVGVGQP